MKSVTFSNPLKQVGRAASLLPLLAALTAHADYASTLSGLSPIGYWRLNEPT